MNDCIARLRKLSAPLVPEPTPLEPRGQRLHGVRCILFDVYGTLLISGSGDVGTASAGNQQVALDAALRATGMEHTFPVEWIAQTIRRHQDALRAEGIALPEIDIVSVWRDLLAQSGMEGITDARCRRVAVEYEARVNPVWVMPGAWEVLAQQKQKGRRLGIVSNAQFYTPLLFPALSGRALTDWGFEPELCIWSFVQREGKPSPHLFKLALDLLAAKGIRPAQVLYIGNDMRNDMWPAAEQGCRTALFAGDRRSLRLREEDPRCNHITPDLVLTDWSQLARWL